MRMMMMQLNAVYDEGTLLLSINNELAEKYATRDIDLQHRKLKLFRLLHPEQMARKEKIREKQ